MGDNAFVVVHSKCKVCGNLIQFNQSGTNDWIVQCKIKGEVKPMMVCEGYIEARD